MGWALGCELLKDLALCPGFGTWIWMSLTWTASRLPILIASFSSEYDSDDNPREETIKPVVDGGTEGFKGHARVITSGHILLLVYIPSGFFPPQVKFPLCTLAETPRTAAHCIEYAHLIKWNEPAGS